MNKTPDTRGKIDNQRNTKQKPKKKKVKSFKQIRSVEVETVSLPTKKKNEKSKGQIFKENFGYSKSMERAARKAGARTIDEYKGMRKSRKRKETEARQEKHAKSVAYKRANKKTSVKGKKQKKAADTVTLAVDKHRK